MKISIIVERNIEKSTKEKLKDIVSMVEELYNSYPNIISIKNVEVTIKD
ncbi:MAG: hypothetical protein K2H01_10795 [Ruminococcus sp.]|nr:hypothetical protein [Ruminococcus sp.]